MTEVKMREENSQIEEGIGVNRTAHAWYVWVKRDEEVVMLRLPLESSLSPLPSYTAHIGQGIVTTEIIK